MHGNLNIKKNSAQRLSETLLVLRRKEGDLTNVNGSSVNVTVILTDLN
jgi:hypothetical protein